MEIEEMSISDKLCVVQSKLKAPKGQYNSFGKYKYRSCEDIVEAVKPLLSEVGISMIMSDQIQLVGDRYYIEATITLSDGNGYLQSTAFAREPQNKKGADESQITGAASSYARKYALNGMFAIDDTRDADATNDHAGDALRYVQADTTMALETRRNNELANGGGELNGNYVVSFGKWDGKKVSDILKEEGKEKLTGYCDFLVKSANSKGKTINGPVLDFIKAVRSLGV